jgi:hypothetical protein
MERSEQINLRLRPGEKARLLELAGKRTLTDYLLRDVREQPTRSAIPRSGYETRVAELSRTMPKTTARRQAFKEGLKP